METYSILIPSYTVGPKAYKAIPEYCKRYGTKAVVIGGHKAMAAAKEKLLAAVAQSDLTITDFLWFGKDCTYSSARALEQLQAVQEADMIFAVGGGKAVDTCKLVSLDLGKPYFSFPTIASNCAAASSLSIVYREDGSFCDFVHLLESAKHIFIDTEIIAQAPVQYLWAGIGDTYAKYYEVSVSAKGERLSHYKAMGVNLSQMCMESLLQHGEQALKDNEQKRPSQDLEQAALAIIITTGWVSMLVARDHTMDYNGGVAHAVFYGLCNLQGFEETHLHGVVVGFGVLMLLLIDGQEEAYQKMVAFNKRVNLPTTLEEIGVTFDQFCSVAEQITQDEDLEHYPYRVTVEMLNAAAKRLER
ncbi:MAG: iron-containing alcohol dehydrogenase family protein [Oscillospiraceae bacterium]|jgi:glycerol dehydrogenase-like iron-containing ADH family enzyme